MAYVVDAKNCAQFGIELGQMYRDRGRVVAKAFEACAGVLMIVPERDRFDKSGATYVLHVDEAKRRHLASFRLLPTAEPHFLSETSRVFCECGSPIATDIWELSWFCVSPDLPRRDEEWMRGFLRLALAEYAVGHGISQFVTIACAQALPEMMAAGWRAKPLGLPRPVGKLLVGAILFTVMPDTLKRAQQQMGIYSPVLRFGERRRSMADVTA